MQASPNPEKINPPIRKNQSCFQPVDQAIKRHHYQQDALIEILHTVQDNCGYLDEEVLAYVARGLKLPLSRVYGVATFYHLFRLQPSGQHTCVVCLGTACYVEGANKIVQELERELGIGVGETTPDQRVSLETARCLGTCGIAPIVVLDEEVMGYQTPETALAQIRELYSSKP